MPSKNFSRSLLYSVNHGCRRFQYCGVKGIPLLPRSVEEQSLSQRYQRSFSSDPVRWRFRDEGPIGIGNEIRVLFAGPHFHASLPSLQAELDRRKTLVTSEFDKSNSANGRNSNIVLVHAPTKDELWEQGPTADVAIPFMERFPKDFFAPEVTPKLRLVVQFGVGLEGVDVSEATERGIAVSNVPAEGTGNAQATSEHAVYLAISLLRGFPTQDYLSRFPNRSLGGLPIPRTIYKKRVTVVGYGAVGSCLAKYLSALSAKVTVVRKTPWEATKNTENNIFPISKVESLEEALPNTDVLFLACTLTEDTKSLINESTIALLPKGALVVNIARGALVDHSSMLAALQSGQIGGFASDVGIGHPTKPSEPWDPNDEICNLGPNANVLFTPHVGGYCDASYSVMVHKIADSIEHVARGEAPPIWVNRPAGVL